MTARELQAQKTYENIILTAEQLTENNSFENISVDLICAKAGISKGGFYHHFPSKDLLISLLIGRQMGNLIEERIEPFFNKKNAFALLQIYIDTMVSYMENSPQNVLARCWVALSEHPEMTNAAFAQNFFHIIHKIVVQGKSEGSIRPDLTDEFCQAYLTGTITGIMLYGTTFQAQQTLHDFASQSLELICKTLR